MPRTLVGNHVMSQLQTLFGAEVRCTVLERVTCVRLIGRFFLRSPWRRCRRYKVDSEASYTPSSASCGTSCFGDSSAYRELVRTLSTCASSAGERALCGR